MRFTTHTKTLAFLVCAVVAVVVACSSDAVQVPANDAGLPDSGTTDGGDGGPAATYGVGGSATGVLGTGLVLQNNAGDDLPIAANGSFTFATKLTAGTAYAVTIKTQPTAPPQTCTVSGGTGTMGAGNVTTVTVNCAAKKFTVGGTVSGLAGTGLVLQNNAGDDLVVSANGTFAFATTLLDTTAYAVTVKTQPGSPSQACAVTNGSGTIAAANVTNVTVSCTTNRYTVGGMAAGLVGSGLVLQNNAGDDLTVAASGAFTFATSIASGASYAITVKTQPTSPTQTCTVSGGTGTVGAANVTSVTVNCATNTYTIGGTASGIVGSGLVLQNNAGDDLAVNASGSFAFATPIASGAAYAVTIKTQPSSPSQTCVLTAAAGTVAAANVTTVGVSCTTNAYKVGGTVSGLAGTGLVLQDNGGDDLPIAADGSFQFATSVSSGATYSVTVKTQPTALSQSCIVTSGTSTIGGADVTNVTVTCVTNTYTVGGTVSGLSGTGLVLKDNGGDNLAIPGNGTFSFATKVLSGGAYAVTVGTQPSSPSQTCTVSAGSGTVTNGNVVTVAVSCATNTYTVGGTTSGLLGTGMVLQNNAGDDLTVNGNGSFAFGTPIASGATYAVTVKTNPTNPSQTCVVGSATGTVGGANVTSVTVNCATKSCATAGDGLTNCGGGSESCCTSLLVSGGTYNRTYTNTGSGPTGEADPATVSDFRLDKYEVTVGRFRQFVAAWNGGAGWKPPAASGKHTHLNAGSGLAATGGGYEPGWATSDNSNIAPTDPNLACQAGYQTWTPTSAGGHEMLPINCVNSYEAAAFCIWDGGFLPSEAEWEYAAAGGSEEREYPWGSTAPGTSNQYAIYGCYYPSNSSGNCNYGVYRVAPVGTPTAGAGKWGQLDLGGNVYEWNLDWYAAYAPCTNCTNATIASYRVVRGGAYYTNSSSLYPWGFRPNSEAPSFRYYGFRCARTP